MGRSPAALAAEIAMFDPNRDESCESYKRDVVLPQYDVGVNISKWHQFKTPLFSTSSKFEYRGKGTMKVSHRWRIFITYVRTLLTTPRQSP